MPGGRPLKFKSVEELSTKIDAYFSFCDEKGKPYTVSGLAVYLDCGIKTLKNYENDDEFLPTIKKAKDKIQNFAEEKLFDRTTNATGVIFNLKNNWGWKDKTEQETTHKGEALKINVNFVD